MNDRGFGHVSKRKRTQRWLTVAAALCIAALLAILVREKRRTEIRSNSADAEELPSVSDPQSAPSSRSAPKPRQTQVKREHIPTPEEVVSGNVTQFVRSRREFVRAAGQRLNQDLPPEIQTFFDELESG